MGSWRQERENNEGGRNCEKRGRERGGRGWELEVRAEKEGEEKRKRT